MNFQNIFLLYFLRKLVTPCVKTDAYKLGLIDENGVRLKKIADLKTTAEKNALTRWDILVFNIKRLIEKLPLGKTKLATLATALFLLRESNSLIQSELEESELALGMMIESHIKGMNKTHIAKVYENIANVSGSGMMAGLNGEAIKKNLLRKQPVGRNPNEYDEDIDAFFTGDAFSE